LDRAPHSLLDASPGDDQVRMGGCPARHGSSMRPGIVKLPGEDFGLQARLADPEAAISRPDLLVEVPKGCSSWQREQVLGDDTSGRGRCRPRLAVRQAFVRAAKHGLQ
jgi:hypothetical protein